MIHTGPKPARDWSGVFILIVAAIVGIVMFIPAFLYAQGVEPKDTIQFVTEIVNGLQEGSHWSILAALIAWGLLQILMAKQGFRIPWLSEKLVGLEKNVRTILVLVLSAASGALVAWATSDAGAIINGALQGLGTGFTAMGMHQGVKNMKKEGEVLR